MSTALLPHAKIHVDNRDDDHDHPELRCLRLLEKRRSVTEGADTCGGRLQFLLHGGSLGGRRPIATCPPPT